MFDAFWNFWDWISAGFCDPWRASTFAEKAYLDQSTAPCGSNIQDVWTSALETGQLKLQKFSIESSTLEYLMEETNKLKADERMSEIMLFWCSFNLTNGMAEETLDFIEANAHTLTAISFWKTREEETIPNEILWLLLTKSIPQKLLSLQNLELSYFDLRQRNLSQALANMITQPHCNVSYLDISYCKTNKDFFTRFLDALKQYKYLKTLCLSGNGIDDSTLRIICKGLNASCSSLQQLHLSHNLLTPASLPTLATLLKQSPYLEALYLQHNETLLTRCSSEQIKAFATALADATSLHTLNFAGCGLSNAIHIAAILFQGGLKPMPLLHDLDLSHNHKLKVDLEWLLPLCQCKTLQYLTLPHHMRNDTHQWDILSRVLMQYNSSLLDLKFANAKGSPANTLTKPMEDLLRRNQLLCLARTCAHQLPISLWPSVVLCLYDKNAPGSSTSIYGFLQKCLIG